MRAKRPWLTVKEFAPFYGKSESAIYEEIRTGGFLFEYRQNGKCRSILISARDYGLEIEEAREGDQSLATAAPAHA